MESQPELQRKGGRWDREVYAELQAPWNGIDITYQEVKVRIPPPSGGVVIRWANQVKRAW